ncbi:unnamed protein product [Calypogeia fissa]
MEPPPDEVPVVINFEAKFREEESKIKEVKLEAEAQIKKAKRESDAKIKEVKLEAEAQIKKAKRESDAKIEELERAAALSGDYAAS